MKQLRDLPGLNQTDALEHAITIAAVAHSGQVDKQGAPYILHVLRVMLAVPQECRIPAVLHDVVEDTLWSTIDLFKEGISAQDLGVIDRLTRRKGEEYEDYIKRTAGDPRSRTIKVADIFDNIGRMDQLPPAKQARLRPRYEKALNALAKASLVNA